LKAEGIHNIRGDKVEEAIKEIQTYCRNRQSEVDKRFENGTKKFTDHEGRIRELEKDTDNLCNKFMAMNNRLNQILGSVVVACILLVLNLLIGRF
jgi:predicted RNase H-like nuclease (RuvC/YqgF family)